MGIKAIETRYKGCRFRSRLEARWAVFFDTLDTRWVYETEGFVFPDGSRYLPDFWLPDLKLWVEIKGSLQWQKVETPTWSGWQSPEISLLEKFSAEADQAACLISGNIGEHKIRFSAWQTDDGGCGGCQTDSAEWCWSGNRLTLDLHIRKDAEVYADHMFEQHLPWFNSVRRCGKAGSDVRIGRAYAAARSARFEHGEQG